ncbi:MAG TPA: hypothetical protein VNE40_00290 [Candidatus Dormibacteraeota bacterium]|nr:hypothetical protein [Candidatus Dormibacteraeota bacterium]
MIPFIAKIEELSFITIHFSGSDQRDSKHNAIKGGGIVVTIVPATVSAAGFIDHPHLEVLDTLEWGFHLKIVNPSKHEAVAITAIDCRFIGRNGFGAVSNPYSGSLYALEKPYPQKKINDSVLDSFPLLIMPQSTAFYKFTTQLQTYRKKYGLVPVKKAFRRDEVRAPESYGQLQQKRRVTIKTSRGAAVIKF